MTLSHPLPLVLLACLSSCQTSTSTCHAWYLPSSASGDPLPELAAPCVWLTHPADIKTAPAGLATVSETRRQQFMRRVAATERLFFEGDPQQAAAELEGLCALAIQYPELLPTGPKERAGAYRLFVTWMRLQFEAGRIESAQATATWLAAHMPEQEPSVRTMPPELEVFASRALEKTRSAAVTLTVASPEDCPGRAQVLVDGLVLGFAPLQSSIALGRHALWLSCDGATSWVRSADVTGDWSLAGVRLGRESGVALIDGVVTWPARVAQPPDSDLLRSVASWSGLDVVAVRSGESGVLAATPTETLLIPFDPQEPLLLDSLVHHEAVLPWLAAALGVTTVALAGTGVWAHVQADDATAGTNSGVRDLRTEAGRWQDTASGLYVAAAATATCAAGLLMWQFFTAPSPAQPLVD